MFRSPIKAALCLIGYLLGASMLHAGQPEPQVSANELVRETIANEVGDANQPKHGHMFQSRRQTPKTTQTRLYVETKDAMAGMLIAVNDRPLSPEQVQAEQNHLAWLAGNPDQLRKKHSREKEDEDRTLRILKALPDAFRYEYAGTEAPSADVGKTGDQLVKVKFTPNPNYTPPTHVEQVLEGMQGYLLIDRSVHRLATIDGTLFRDVSFGWGIVGHLDKGGHFHVQQADVGDGCWEVTSMSLKITGKILVFKSISMISDEKISDFHAVPDSLSFSQGVDMLKNEQEKLAHNPGPEATADKKEPR